MAFPDTPLDSHVEIFVGGVWVDITADVDLSGSERVETAGGRRDESAGFDPPWASWRLNNGASRVAATLGQSGCYSPLNPMSAYYGRIGRNTPVRWRIGSTVRFIGEIPSWPPRWNRLHTVQWVPIRAQGTTVRLARAAPLESATRRYIPTTNPVAYWHMEEGALAENSASAVDIGTTALRPATGLHAPSGLQFGAVQFGRGVVAPWLPAGVARAGTGVPSALWASVSMPTFAGSWTIDQLYAGTTGGTWSAITDVNPSYLSGSTSTWPQMMFRPDDGTIQMSMDGVPVAIPAGLLFDGNCHHVRWTATQSGAQVVWAVYVDGVQAGTASPTMTLPPISTIALYAGGTSAADFAQKDVAIWLSPPDLATAVHAARGWVGETAGRRIERLCREESVPLGAVGDLDATELMGPQYAGMTLLGAAEEAAAVDAGMLFEPRQVSRVVGDFEDGTTDGWAGFGDVTSLVSSTTRAYTGTHSLRATWGPGAGITLVQSLLSQEFVPGVTYTASCRVWIPTGGVNVIWALAGIGFGDTATLRDQWQLISITFTATAMNHSVQLWRATAGAGGEQAFIDDIRIRTDERGLCYRTRESLYNQTATLPLDYAQGHLTEPFEPLPDTAQLVNKATVTRRDGGSYTYQQDTGPLSVRRPQDGGVGEYHKPLTLALRADAQAQQRSSWEVHRGTEISPRYSAVVVDLADNPALADLVLATNLGDLITIANASAAVGPSVIGLIVEGFNESFNDSEWTVAFTGSPAAVYDVGVLDSPTRGRWDTSGSTLVSAVSTSATSWSVAFVGDRWTTDAAEMPIPITIEGEDVLVTAISGTSSPQTFTVTRSANGVVKTHPAGAPLSVSRPAALVWAL